MVEKVYAIAEQDFASDWADHWFQLTTLVIDLISFDKTPPSPPPPTEFDEINYQRIRLWLIEHEQEFIPLWQEFYQAQDWANNPWDETMDLFPDSADWFENPFAFCYKPDNLYRLAHALDTQNGVDTWDINEKEAWTAFLRLTLMGYKMAIFHKWICENTIETA